MREIINFYEAFCYELRGQWGNSAVFLFNIISPLLLFGILYFLFGRYFFKSSGEAVVKRKIESFLKRKNEYRLFNDIILKTPDGTTQIDHVLLSPYGIFVIETKNLGGWIFGEARQKRWAQSFRGGMFYKNTFQFQNPMHQNYKHVKAVQNFLSSDSEFIFSIVVFAGNSKFMTDMPDNVRELHDFIPYIESHAEKIISDEQVKGFCQIFMDYVNNAPITYDDHMKNLEQNMMHPICPKCGILMVLRTAHTGQDAGGEFWGCSNFPSCRTTKRVLSF